MHQRDRTRSTTERLRFRPYSLRLKSIIHRPVGSPSRRTESLGEVGMIQDYARFSNENILKSAAACTYIVQALSVQQCLLSRLQAQVFAH